MTIIKTNNLNQGFLGLIKSSEEKIHVNIGDEMRMFLACALERVHATGHEDVLHMLAFRYFILDQGSLHKKQLLGDECLVVAGLYHKQFPHCHVRVAQDVGPIAYAACSAVGSQIHARASEAFLLLVRILQATELPILKIV